MGATRQVSGDDDREGENPRLTALGQEWFDGHDCSAYCRGGVHAEVVYYREDNRLPLDRALVLSARYYGIESVGYEPAPEAPAAVGLVGFGVDGATGDAVIGEVDDSHRPYLWIFRV